jgi:hypothetical protein
VFHSAQSQQAPTAVSVTKESVRLGDDTVALGRLVASFTKETNDMQTGEDLPQAQGAHMCICSKFPELHPVHDED